MPVAWGEVEMTGDRRPSPSERREDNQHRAAAEFADARMAGFDSAGDHFCHGVLLAARAVAVSQARGT
jgi:hypothetical protein